MLNLCVATTGHRDTNDDTICVILPFGNWTGGAICLYELGLVIDMMPGDIFIFLSSDITHFNLDFKGLRCSLVLHSDKHGAKWVENYNNWQSHVF